MGPSAPPTLEPRKEIIEDEMKTNKAATQVKEQVEGEEVLNPDDTGSGLSTVLNTMNDGFQHASLDEGVRLLNALLIHQLIENWVPGKKDFSPGLPWTTFLAHMVLAIWFILSRKV